MPRITFATAVLLAAAALAAHGQPQQKRFMGGPVTIEDQGSFFVGGVTKVSEYATVPVRAARPADAAARRRSRSRSARCTCSSRSRRARRHRAGP